MQGIYLRDEKWLERRRKGIGKKTFDGVCLKCSKPFESIRKNQKFCSVSCSIIYRQPKGKYNRLPFTEEWKNNISKSRQGLILSKEWKKNISLSGKKAWAEGINKGFTGHYHSEESKKKLGHSYRKNCKCATCRTKRGETLSDHLNFLYGKFKSNKNNCEIRFQSSFELKTCIKLENDDSVKLFGRCTFGIPYILEGKAYMYFPDFLVEYYNGDKEIIEVKPSCLLGNKINVAKLNALRIYCEKNNFVIRIITENQLKEK